MKKKENLLVVAAFLIVLFYSINSFGAPGDLDPTFGQGGTVTTAVGPSGFAVDLKIQSDGKIITLGDSNTQSSFIADVALVRYNADGSLDTSFGTNGITIISETGRQYSKALFIQSDGKYVAVAGDGNRISVYRFDTNGNLDTTYGVNGKFTYTNVNLSQANDALLQPDDKLVIAATNFTDAFVFRLNSSGVLDTSFNGTGVNILSTGSAARVVLENDNRILVRGTNSNIGFFCRLNSDGTNASPLLLLPVFVNPSSKFIFQSDGKIVIGGNRSSEYAINGEFAVTRLNTDLSLDTSFGNGGVIRLKMPSDRSYATSIIPQPNGQLIIGGFTGVAFALTRFNSNGFLDMSFGNSGKVLTTFGFGSHSVFNIAQQPDGKIVMLGNNGNGGFTLTRHILTGTPNTIARAKFSDFNGDGRADLSVFRASAGNWYITPDFVGSFVTRYSGSLPGLISPGDYNGDGKTDAAVFSGSIWNLCYLAVSGCAGETVGQAGDLPVSGDFDGDGKTDATTFRDGNWSYRSSSYSEIYFKQFGQTGDKPLAADFDGDGTADLAVYRPAVGDWYFSRSSDGSFGGVHFGISTDLPVPADYDGDGKTDIAVYRPADGDWYWLNSSNGAFNGFHWGANGDIPVPADYDGDGKADIGVYRSGVWYLYQSTAGFRVAYWGLPTDIPTASAYIR